MGLIKCIDCGKEYSPRIGACPNCGCPTWDNINELYKQKQAINIDHEVFDVSDIVTNIKNNIDSQTTVELLSQITGQSCHEAAYVLQEIKRDNFSPWVTNEYGYLINQQLEKEKQQQQQNQQPIQPARNVPTCPSCNSTNIEKISMTKKAIGFFAVGILSSNVRKQFRCKNCGYKW